MDATVENKISNAKNMTKYLKRAFELFDEGNKGLQLHDEWKNLTLLLGPTGTGKSTYTQLVFTNAKNVMAAEVAIGEFIIEDGDVKIGKSLINSKTINPDFYTKVWGSETITVTDFGGFGDTRDMAYDLAVNCLIKTVADFANSVKMIFFISYPSVRKGVDRTNFMNLLRHITDLLKDVNKFRKGIGLIVTKVDNIVIKKGNQLVLVDDKAVTRNVAEFLIQVKEELKQNLKHNIGDDKDYKENAINIIDILLTKKEESFSKIKLFRRPDEYGPLSTSTLRQDAESSFLELFTQLNYVEKDSDDFRYGLSEKSVNIVNEIVGEIDDIISKDLKTIARIVQEYFQYIQKNIYETIASIMAGTTDAKDHQTEAKELVSEFTIAMYVIKELVDEVKTKTNIEKIVRIVLESISHLKVSIPIEIITDLMNQVKYLDFLQTVCRRKYNMRSSDGIFNNILLFIQALREHLQEYIDKCVKKTEVLLKAALKSLTIEAEKEYTKRMKTLGPESVQSMVDKEKLAISKMIETITPVASTKKRIEVFCNVERDLSISFPAGTLDSISKLKESLFYFENLSDKDISFDPPHCILTLQAFLKLIQEFESWYTFLKDLYDKFSEYEIQAVKHIYNVRNIKDWGSFRAEMGIHITPENYKLFLDKISSFSVAECSSVKNLQLSESRQQELNHILSLTLKSEIKIDCRDTTVTIQGDYISLKSLFNNEHNARLNGDNDNLLAILRDTEIKTVRFFAFHTIFIDQDLDFVGRKISLVFISPNWKVIGDRKIDLSGEVGGEPPFDYPGAINLEVGQAENDDHDHEKANDGVPGKPGGPGGNFYGIVETLINGKKLTILANGGKGGAGQNGQDGREGEDAPLHCIEQIIDFFPLHTFPNWLRYAIYVICAAAAGEVTVVAYVAVRTAATILRFNPFVLVVGAKGEDGGNGGQGGYGGNPGQILLKNDAAVNFFNNNGEPGRDGAGGTGGQSGKNEILTGSESEIFGINTALVEGDLPGTDGTNGLNFTDRKDPEPAPIFNDDGILNNFNDRLINLKADRFMEFHLEKFMNFLENM